ncbi:MAG: OmpH family outer membrane protein [Deltaproteobacteria bacterium]|nr:OmpH family outer membrane protein [Deltaproteobacteria bacterium]
MKVWLVIIMLALPPSFGQAQTVRIGFIDVQRVIAESNAGKRAKERFQVQIKKIEADLLKERQDLERLKADIEKKAPLLKEGERRNLEADFQKRSVNLQRSMGDYQEELRQKEGTMMAELIKELEGVVAEYGKSEKFTVILERSQILYSDQGTDVTAKVIESYNRVKK